MAPAMVAEELELLARALQEGTLYDGRTNDRDEACGALKVETRDYPGLVWSGAVKTERETGGEGGIRTRVRLLT